MAQHTADLVEMRSQLKLAAQELDRSGTLVSHGWQAEQVQDQRQSQFDVAVSAVHGTEAKIAASIAGVESATRNAELIQVDIDDDTRVAPKGGPITSNRRRRHRSDMLDVFAQFFGYGYGSLLRSMLARLSAEKVRDSLMTQGG